MAGRDARHDGLIIPDPAALFRTLHEDNNMIEARRLAFGMLRTGERREYWLHAFGLSILSKDPYSAHLHFTQALELTDTARDPLHAGKVRNALAIAGWRIYGLEGADDLAKVAAMDYRAARGLFLTAGHLDYAASADNNRALLLAELGRFSEAHETLSAALEMAVSEAVRGEILDTRARVYLAQGDFNRAMDSINEAILLLWRHGSRRAIEAAEKFKDELLGKQR